MSIFLTGYRGSGKTTIGRRLADKLWQNFFDADELIVKKAGKSIKEIFATGGEPAFRDLERDALAELVKLDEHVIALGGGTLTRDENRALLQSRKHSIIYLKCDPAELLRRIQSDPATSDNRPNLTPLGGGIEEIKKLLEQREPMYRQAMTAEVDVTHLTPDEAVVYIVRLL